MSAAQPERKTAPARSERATTRVKQEERSIEQFSSGRVLIATVHLRYSGSAGKLL
jgi:hypothetical protein